MGEAPGGLEDGIGLRDVAIRQQARDQVLAGAVRVQTLEREGLLLRERRLPVAQIKAEPAAEQEAGRVRKEGAD